MSGRDVLIVRDCGHRQWVRGVGPWGSEKRANYKRGVLCPECPKPRPKVDDHLPVGTVLCIGHPDNGVTWFRTAFGWIDNAGENPQRGHRADAFYDTIGHGAYEVLRLGTGR